MVALSRHWHVPSALRPSPLRLESDQARVLVERGALLIDVRRQDDPEAAYPGAERVPPDEFPGRVVGMRREVAIVLACT